MIPTEIAYATFAGALDQTSLPRIFQNFSGATQANLKTVHLLFQSTGGTIGDGISLYNFFRALPLELHIYNTGSVQSVGVIAYLGAKHRHASTHSNFMIHKAHFPAQAGVNAAKLQALGESLAAEDLRVEVILKACKISDEIWAAHAMNDVTFSAQQAIDFEVAQDICEFQVPAGNQIFNI